MGDLTKDRTGRSEPLEGFGPSLDGSGFLPEGPDVDELGRSDFDEDLELFAAFVTGCAGLWNWLLISNMRSRLPLKLISQRGLPACASGSSKVVTTTSMRFSPLRSW